VTGIDYPRKTGGEKDVRVKKEAHFTGAGDGKIVRGAQVGEPMPCGKTCSACVKKHPFDLTPVFNIPFGGWAVRVKRVLLGAGRATPSHLSRGEM